MALAAESAVSIAFALLTRRLIRFRRALSERVVTSFEQLKEFGFGAANLIFHVPGLHGLGKEIIIFDQKVRAFKSPLAAWFINWVKLAFNLGHPLRTIVSLGSELFDSQPSPATLGSRGFSRSATGVARAPFLELKCFGWFPVTDLILNIMSHGSPPLDRSTHPLRRTPLFLPVCFSHRLTAVSTYNGSISIA